METTGDALRGGGYTVDAFNYQEIVDAVAQELPDILVVGLSSKVEGTHNICRELKSNEKTNHIPILLAGNQKQLNQLIDSIDHGADGYFIKPVKTDELLAKIKAFIRLKGMQQDLRNTNQLLEKKERELAERNNELANLYEISQKLTRCLELDKVLQVLFDKAHELLKADRCFLQLVVESGREVTELFQTRVDFGEIKHHSMVIEKEGVFVKKVIEDKTPIVVNRAKTSPLVDKRFAYKHDLKTVLFVPLVNKDEVIGILLICRDKQGVFTEEQMRMAQIIGSDAAFSIERAQLYEKTKDLHSTLKAIVEWGDSGIIMVDKDRIVRTANRQLCHMLGLTKTAIVGESEKNFVKKTKNLFKDPEQFEARLNWLRAKDSDVVTDHLEMAKPDSRLLERYSGPVFDADGEFMGRIDIYHDVTTRKQSERRIRNLYRKERKIAHILQKNLLPKEVPTIPGYDFGTKYAAAVQGMVIGGDYFDFIYIDDNQVAMAIGDVCGKGIAAAVQTYLVKYSLRAFAREDPDPAVVISRLNWTFCQEVEENAFVTLVYGLLDHRKDVLRYCIAGHPRPIIYRSQQGEFETLESNGGIAGVIPESYYRGQVVRLNINDVTVLFTDGIIEARSARGFFGEHRLKAIVESSREETAQKIADQIFAGVSRFTSNNLNDDAAVVVLKKIS